MKTSELIGPALDWAVAKCEGVDSVAAYLFHDEGYYNYSIDWAQGGPIIEREEICLQKVGFFGEDEGFGPWAASGAGNSGYGPTPLIAAMRCYAASKFGDEIELPEELK